MMAVKSGKSIRLKRKKLEQWVEQLQELGIKLANENDEVVGMVCVDNMQSSVLVVSENGFGKRSHIED